MLSTAARAPALLLVGLRAIIGLLPPVVLAHAGHGHHRVLTQRAAAKVGMGRGQWALQLSRLSSVDCQWEFNATHELRTDATPEE